MSKYLDLTGLTAYDKKIKAWHHKHIVDITDDEIRALFETSAYEMVDLGLPSGLKWATCNVGAETPQDYGLYFSWGNVEGHAVDENGNIVDGYSFNETTYASTSGDQYTGSTLDAEHDAATVNMGDGWRMPTVDETRELVKETTQTIDTENGGAIFTSKTNGNSIFIPFAGYCDGSLLVLGGLGCSVWSSSVSVGDEEFARYLYFRSGSGIYGGSTKRRSYGLSVRGVHE